MAQPDREPVADLPTGTHTPEQEAALEDLSELVAQVLLRELAAERRAAAAARPKSPPRRGFTPRPRPQLG